MNRHDDKMARAAHIKRRTMGTSNEISFDVLDAAKDALDSAKGTSAAGLVGGGIGSVAGGNAVWPAPAEEEVVRRKKERRHRRRLAYALVCAVCAAAVGGAGWWLYGEYRAQQAYVGELDQAISCIESADEVVVPLNEALSDLFELPEGSVAGEALAEELAACVEGLSGAEEELLQAEELLHGVGDALVGPTDKEAANRAVLAIDGRREMIDAGAQIAGDAQDASRAAEHAEEAWDLLLQADSLAREAASTVTDTTDENVSSSMEETNRAIELFQQADDEFAAAADVYPAVDFADYRAYIAKRVEAMGYALAADEAFLARDKDEVSLQNDAYNDADAEAASLAADFPETPVNLIAEASSAATAEARESYVAACSQAASADAFLRDYLGTNAE